MSTVLDKFLRYVKIDTQSQDGATTVPSTDKQRNLASLLAQELNDMGAQDVVYDKAHCYVYATIPSNLPEGKTDRQSLCGSRKNLRKRWKLWIV